MSKNKLTPKREKFVQELVKGKTQRAAYKLAFNAKKMNNNSIDREASLLFKNPMVSQRYWELMGKVTQRAEEKTIVTAEEILQNITNIARDDISNYLSFGTEDNGEIRISLKDSDEMDTSNISEISLTKDGQFKFKLYESDKAWYKLAEIFGMNKLAQDKQKLAEEKFIHEKDIDSKKYW